MKKIKLLCVTAATCLATVSPLIITTSCGNPNKDIDIKSNPNIKIECGQITVGQELVIKYTLDSGYSHDIENSTITFQDSNVTVTLLQCKVDEAKCTITVPAEFVVSKKVTIDIKAEDITQMKVDQTEYTAAIALLENLSADRKFTISGTDWHYEWSEQQQEYLENAIDLVIEANGFKEHQTETQVSTQLTAEAWAEKDPIIGYWAYSRLASQDKPERRPEGTTWVYSWLHNCFEYSFPRQISGLTYSTLYNAYYRKTKDTYSEALTYIKFKNKKITYMGSYNRRTNTGSGQPDYDACELQISYTTKDISMPTDYVDPSYENQIHMDPARYVAGTKSLTYTYKTNDDWEGRYVIPMYKCTDWDNTSPIKVKIEAQSIIGFQRAMVGVASGTTPLTSGTDYTVDTTTGEITINRNKVDETKELIILLSNPMMSEPARMSGFTKMTISQ